MLREAQDGHLDVPDLHAVKVFVSSSNTIRRECSNHHLLGCNCNVLYQVPEDICNHSFVRYFSMNLQHERTSWLVRIIVV